MRLGLVSDSHDNLALARTAAAFLREQACDLVLHLGDVTTGATVGVFHGLPMRFVRGNNDDNRDLAPALARHGFPKLVDVWRDRIEGVEVAAHHGHYPPALGDVEPDLLLHGHTHRRRCERVGRTLVVNPGALYRAATKSLALVDLPTLEVEFFEVGRDGVTRMPRP